MTTVAAPEPKGLFLSIPIRKVDEAKREVWGFATKEELDQQGEIVEYEASKTAFSNFADQFQKSTGGLSMGALREMHQPKAVGSLIAYRPDDKEKGIWIGAKLSRSADGENAFTKVKEGVLTGFSIGAPIAEREMTYDPKSGKRVNRVVSYKLSEVSLVDNPACPSAVIHQVKLAKTVGTESAVPSGLLDPITFDPSEESTPAPIEKGLEANAYVDGFGQVWKRVAPAPAIKADRWSSSTPEQREWVSNKIRILVNEGKPQEQAVAIAHSMAEDHFSKSNKEAAMSGATKEVRNIGPQHTESSSPGAVVPKLPEVVSGEEATVPKAGEKAAPAVDEAGKPVTVPDGQGKTSGFPAQPAGAAPVAAPAPMAAPHPPAAPGTPPKFCGYCGQGLPQPSAPPAGAPPTVPPAPGAPKSAAVGVEPSGLEKALAMNAEALQLTLKGVDALTKRVDQLAAMPTGGGPRRTELPPGVAPVEKGVAGAPGSGVDLSSALQKAIDTESDPYIKDALRKRLVTEQIKKAQSGVSK